MAIRFSCPTCKKALSAPDEKAGATVKCPGCKTAFMVPTTAAPVAAQIIPAKKPDVPAIHKTPGIANPENGLFGTFRQVVKAALSTFIGSQLSGLVGDLLKPLASINAIAFTGSSALAVLFLYFSVKRGRIARFARLACSFFVILAAGFGSWLALAHYAGGGEKGFLAEHIPFVANIQSGIVTKVEGEKLGSEVQHQLKVEKQAAESLQEALQGFPATFIRAEVVGEPRIKKKSGTSVVLEYDLMVSIDPDTFDSFTTKLIPILDKTATAKGEVFASAQVDETFQNNTFDSLQGMFDWNTAVRMKDHIRFSPVMRYKEDIRSEWLFKTEFGRQSLKSTLDESQMVVAVNIKRSGSDDRTTWKWYHVPLSKSFASRIAIDIRFNDKTGRELSREQFQFDPYSSRYIPGVVYQNSYPVFEAMIAPYHMLPRGGYCRTITIPLEVTLTPARSVQTRNYTVLGNTEVERTRSLKEQMGRSRDLLAIWNHTHASCRWRYCFRRLIPFYRRPVFSMEFAVDEPQMEVLPAHLGARRENPLGPSVPEVLRRRRRTRRPASVSSVGDGLARRDALGSTGMGYG